jgi:hypothetical protein
LYDGSTNSELVRRRRQVETPEIGFNGDKTNAVFRREEWTSQKKTKNTNNNKPLMDVFKRGC